MSSTSASSRAGEARAKGIGHARGPTLITEQEVMFSTAVAAGSVRPTVWRRVATWLARLSVGHLRPPPVQYPNVRDYLEPARMSREMERL